MKPKSLAVARQQINQGYHHNLAISCWLNLGGAFQVLSWDGFAQLGRFVRDSNPSTQSQTRAEGPRTDRPWIKSGIWILLRFGMYWRRLWNLSILHVNQIALFYIEPILPWKHCIFHFLRARARFPCHSSTVPTIFTWSWDLRPPLFKFAFTYS